MSFGINYSCTSRWHIATYTLLLTHWHSLILQALPNHDWFEPNLYQSARNRRDLSFSRDQAVITGLVMLLFLARRISQLWDIPVNPWAKVNTTVMWAQIWLLACLIAPFSLCRLPCHCSVYSKTKQKQIPKLYICRELWRWDVPPTQAGRQAAALETQTPPNVANAMEYLD